MTLFNRPGYRSPDALVLESRVGPYNNGSETEISSVEIYTNGSERFNADAYFKTHPEGLTLSQRIRIALLDFQPIYYPILAVVAILVNVLTIVILSRGKCGLSKTVTRYLLAMAAADLAVAFLDVVLMKIPKAFPQDFSFLFYVRVCRTHVFLLQAATDSSVWFTVAFTFDRFVAICFQDLTAKYCTGRTAAVVLSTVTALSCLKNVFWFFMVQDTYASSNIAWPCMRRWEILFSLSWAVIDLARTAFSTVIPFLVVIVLNAFTITHVLLASRARGRLRASSRAQSSRDPEMQCRRKSLVLLLVVSGNFILLWALYGVMAVWNRMVHAVVTPYWLTIPSFFNELSYMLQLLSCCTNTALYAVSQTKFRQQLKQVLTSPLTLIPKRIGNGGSI